MLKKKQKQKNKQENRGKFISKLKDQEQRRRKANPVKDLLSNRFPEEDLNGNGGEREVEAELIQTSCFQSRACASAFSAFLHVNPG